MDPCRVMAGQPHLQEPHVDVDDLVVQPVQAPEAGHQAARHLDVAPLLVHQHLPRVPGPQRLCSLFILPALGLTVMYPRCAMYTTCVTSPALLLPLPLLVTHTHKHCLHKQCPRHWQENPATQYSPCYPPTLQHWSLHRRPSGTPDSIAQARRFYVRVDHTVARPTAARPQKPQSWVAGMQRTSARCALVSLRADTASCSSSLSRTLTPSSASLREVSASLSAFRS